MRWNGLHQAECLASPGVAASKGGEIAAVIKQVQGDGPYVLPQLLHDRPAALSCGPEWARYEAYGKEGIA